MKIKSISKKLILILLIMSFGLGMLSSCGTKTQEYYSSADELADKRISIWMGFTYDPWIRSVFPDADYYYYGDINLMVEALKSDKIEAFAYEECFQSFADHDHLDLNYLYDLNYETSYAFCFSDTEKGTRLLNEFNEFVSKAKASGELDLLQSEWMYSGELKTTEDLNTWDTSNGTVEFTTSATAVPFIYISENKVSGYEAALLIEFCKEYHYALNITLATWDAMIANVQSGKYDMCAQSIEASDEHKKSLAMSVDTFNGNFVLYVKSNPANQPKFASMDELNGLTGAAILGTIDEQLYNDRFPDSKVVTFQNVNDCVVGVLNGKADFTVSDEMGADNIVNSYDGITYFNEAFYEQPIGAIFNKDIPESQALKIEFNNYIKECQENGKLDRLFSKWNKNKAKADKEKRTFTGKQITIALEPVTVPYTFMKNGEPTGFEVELIEKFCEDYGYTPEYLIVDFSGLVPSIISGKADMAAAVICYTEERAESVDFSDIYLYDELKILVPTKGEKQISGWESVKRSFERTFIEENRWKMFASGILTTLEITLVSAIIGTFFGFIFYMFCRNGNRLLNSVFDVLARIFAGLPVIIILMILFYVIFTNLNGTIISIIGFSTCTALNVFSSLKTAVKSIDVGQTEGAYALGFTDMQTFYKIVLPQALQQFIPNYKGLMINLINGTAVVGFIAVQDLTRTSDLIRAVTYEAFLPLIATAIIYFVLGVLLTSIVKKIQFNFEPEKRSEERILAKYKL